MKKMTSLEIRKMWLDFFQSKGHKVVESAPIIPKDDDSLLWINAGVTPLKKYFDGSVVPDNRRVTNIQKCIRTNDIENVGVTRRHHTFFEMMGNFSIGDYFKNEAIEFAFELLTSPKWFNIPIDKKGKESYLEPWTFTSNDNRFVMTFKPIIDRHADTDLKILCSLQHQVFGVFNGTMILDDGTQVKIVNQIGFAEKVFNKW